jgi:Right handed beta helix region
MSMMITNHGGGAEVSMNFRARPRQKVLRAMLAYVANVAAVFCTVSGSLAQVGQRVDIFVRTDGDDRADGLTSATAVSTLQRAGNIAFAPPLRDAEIRIEIDQGRYVGKGATWLVPEQFDGSVRVAAGAPGKASIFDGQHEAGQWLSVKSPWGKPLRLEISGLEVTNFLFGLLVEGDREKPDAWVSGVVVRKMVFSNIGQFRRDQPPAYAAVTFANARNGRVTDTRFENLTSTTGCTGMHAIYLAHRSSGNVVARNTFKDVNCGFVVKTRDRSNENIFTDNHFDTPKVNALFGDDLDSCQVAGTCINPSRTECSSYGNTFVRNTISDATRASNVQLARVGREAATQVCLIERPKTERLRAGQ